MAEPCARCGLQAATLSVLCSGCAARGPLSPAEMRRFRARQAEDAAVTCPDCGSGWPGFADGLRCPGCLLDPEDIAAAADLIVAGLQ